MSMSICPDNGPRARLGKLWLELEGTANNTSSNDIHEINGSLALGRLEQDCIDVGLHWTGLHWTGLH